jgi:hypothetical protein
MPKKAATRGVEFCDFDNAAGRGLGVLCAQ